MSDFLSHLAFKSLHPTQAVQPRLAGRFEPTRPAVEPAAEPMATEATEAIPATGPLFYPLRTQPDKPAMPPRLASRPAPMTQELIASSSTDPNSLPNPKPTTVMSSSPLAIATPQHIGEAPLQEPEAQPYRLPPERSIASSESPPIVPFKPSPQPLSNLDPSAIQADLDALARQLQRLERAPRRSVTKLEPETLTGAVRAETRRSDPGPQRDQPARAVSPVPPPALPSTTLTVTPQIRPLPPLPPIQPPPPEKPAMPTIQVTIGRIEVRATPLPPSAKKSVSATPTMSLDEYLRQRNGRQR